MKRRRFIAASGTASVALFAGCVSEQDDSADDGSGDGETEGESSEDEQKYPDELPEDVETVLDALPEQVGDEPVQQIMLFSPDPDADDHSEADHIATELETEIGIDPADVDRMGTAMYGDFAESVAVVTGSFAADSVTDPDDTAVHAEDEFAIGAVSDETPWEEGRDRAVSVADDPDAGVLTQEAKTLFTPLVESEVIISQFNLDVGDELLAPEYDDSIEVFAFGQQQLDELTEKVHYVAIFEDTDAVDEGILEEVIEEDNQSREQPDIEFTHDDRRLVAEFEQMLPSHRLPDDSPDANFTLHENGTVLAHTGEEPVDPANLELLVDGESVETPWDDHEGDIEPDDQFEVEFEPFTLVEVEWHDPERDGVTHRLGQDVVAVGDVFADEYDREANELTITYDGDVEVDSDRLELSRMSSHGSSSDEPELSELVGETLTPDDEFTVDLDYSENLSISVTAEGDELSVSQTVFSFNAQPPGQFSFDQDNGTLTVEYRDEKTESAAHYEIQRNDETTAVQFDDEYDQLTDGDSVELDAELGDNFQILWTGEDEPVSVSGHVVVPDVEFAIDHDEAELEITHDGGEAVDADALTLDVFPSGAEIDESPWEDEYDRVTEGDSVVAELDEDTDAEFVNVLFEGNMIDNATLGTRS